MDLWKPWTARTEPYGTHPTGPSNRDTRDGIVHNCCRVSAANKELAFVVHRVGVFGGPVIEQIARPENVQISETDDCVVVKDGRVYQLTWEEI